MDICDNKGIVFHEVTNWREFNDHAQCGRRAAVLRAAVAAGVRRSELVWLCGMGRASIGRIINRK